MEINIDKRSGFCFGVLKAIEIAEEQLKNHGSLFCLGHIVHNNHEVERLNKLGMVVINHQDMKQLFNTRVLIRAHGEPPETYELARQNKIDIIDASCPVVLKLQNRIRESYQEAGMNQGQVVIFGKEGHAEVIGLAGQTENQAIVVDSDFNNLDKIDFSRPIYLYSQTTQNKEKYQQLISLIREKMAEHQCGHSGLLKSRNSICGQVANRGPHLAQFARQHDVVIFVSGKDSSNGRYLFGICQENNPLSFFVSGKEDIQKKWFNGATRAGICGATSTPLWLMEEIAQHIQTLSSHQY